MNEEHPGNPPPSIKPGDILYVIFRHKWKILIISGLGIIATCLFPFFTPRMYQSEAKLLIKYVLEGKSARQVGVNETQIRPVDSQGENIINTAIQILTSLDLARNVATVIGPENVLAKAGGGTNVEAAASFIRANLTTDVPKSSSVIRLVFSHPDRQMVRPILKQVMESYVKMQTEIYWREGGGMDDFLTQETDQLYSRLTDTEGALRKAKSDAGIISLEDSKKSYSEQMSKIQAALLDAEAEMAQLQTHAEELGKMTQTRSALATNRVAVSNTVAVPAEKESEYKRICRVLENEQRREDELLQTYTPENSQVKAVEAQIADTEKLKQQMEEKYPGLLTTKTWERPATAADMAAGLRPDLLLVNENTKLIALAARIQVLTNQLDTIRKEATNLNTAESSIMELQRKLDFDESRYKVLYQNLEQTRIDERLGTARISNISTIQEASPPFIPASKMLKTMALILFGSIGAAFALALAVEYYLDPSLKRPAEVESKLGVPLFLSIPLFRENGHSHALNSGKKAPLLAESNPEKPPGNGEPQLAKQESNGVEEPLALARESTGESGIARWDSEHPMHPFSDALRDRLISFFEIKNMTHKPKLVALTSCKEGSGVSTVAAGLAASLSETGDGNVLLVDMNQQEGSAQQFYRGNPACLDDALKADTRDNALVQDNLYVVAESSTGDNLPRALPRRFKNIVPKLKASDFDYIIFDLPPVNQISMTPRLARFMDVILMVIESETTDKDVLKKGITLLHESQPNVGTVLNKRRSYVPKWLQQEF